MLHYFEYYFLENFIKKEKLRFFEWTYRKKRSKVKAKYRKPVRWMISRKSRFYKKKTFVGSSRSERRNERAKTRVPKFCPLYSSGIIPFIYHSELSFGYFGTFVSVLGTNPCSFIHWEMSTTCEIKFKLFLIVWKWKISFSFKLKYHQSF